MRNRFLILLMAVGAAIFMVAPVQANTISILDDTSGGNPVIGSLATTGAIQGYLIPEPGGFPAPGTPSSFFSDAVNLPNSGTATEIAALFLVTGAIVTTAPKDESGNSPFTINTEYFSVTFGFPGGNLHAFFRNSALVPLLLSYTDLVSGSGGGLSHVTAYGSPAVIPIPPAVILFLTGLAGVGWLGRRKSRAAVA